MAYQKAIGRREMLALAGGFALSGRAAFAQGLRPLKIVNTSGNQNLVFGEVMKEQGYFPAFGVDARPLNVSDGSKIIAALVSGTGELCGGAGFSSLFPAMEKGARIKILGGALLSPILCVYSKRPDIRQARDLVGKSVAVGAPGALLHELMVAWLTKKGVDYTKVNFVNVGSGPNVFKAVVAGTVDAGPAEVDFYEHQAQYGVHSLAEGELWNEMAEYTDQAIFASERAIAEKRDLIVRALAAYAKLFRFVASPASHDIWSRARVAALGRTGADDAESQWKFFQAPGRLATNLALNQGQLDFIQNLNVKLGVQRRVLPFNQIADMTLARDALKLLG
jgi:ABC-type nitrate/sulfonate/bicarbonate transport system substrate-binding protein